MTKPGFSQGTDIGTDHAKVKYAADVAARLAEGEMVAPEVAAHSKETLLNALWSNQPGARDDIQTGLTSFFSASANPEDQAQLIGELVAAGSGAQPILDQFRQHAAADPVGVHLTDQEWDEFRSSLSDNPKARLHKVALRLADEFGTGQNSSGESDAAAESDKQEAINDKRRNFSHNRPARAAGEGDPEGGGGNGEGKAGKTGPEMESSPDLLDNPAQPDGTRLMTVLALGSSVVPRIAEMLLNEPSQREFASTALMHLGKNPETARAVYDEARRLESHPEVRSCAERVRRFAEGDTGEESMNPDGRQQALAASVGDGWLRRALDSCDCQNILQAAEGREILAIPLALRQLVAMRIARLRQP